MSDSDPLPPDEGTSTFRLASLLASLFLVIGVGPFFQESLSWLFEGVLFFTLLAGARASSAEPGRRLTLAILGVVAVGTRAALWSEAGSDLLLFAFLAAYMAFFSLVALTIVHALFRQQHRVTGDSVCGALSVYLILGLIWSMAYVALECLSPGSYLFGGERVDTLEFNRFMGFSFATLTTVGYGNVAPATSQADALAMIEAIIGQFYMAVVIARFVALHILQATSESD